MSYTRLVFGFPVRAEHPFTTVREGSSYCIDGAVEDWLAVFARSQGIELLPPFADDEENEKSVEELEARQALETAWYERVSAVLNEQFGGASLGTQGSEDWPTFLVVGLSPKLEHEPGIHCLRHMPDTTVPAGVVEGMKRFCEVMGIAWEEPRWFLADSYGFD